MEHSVSEAQHTTPSRRDFLQKACPAAILLLVGGELAGCDSDPVGVENEPAIVIEGNTIRIDLTRGRGQELANAGGFLLITEAHTLVLNVDGTTIRAFTSICTHKQCDVNQFSNGRFTCPCHGSQYDTSGEVVQGPAPQPLEEFTVSRDGNVVTVVKE